MPFLSLKPRFKISFARPEVVVASILKRAFTPAVLSHCSCSLPCCIQAAPSSMSSRLDIPSHVSLSLSVLSRPLQCILQFEEIVFPRQARFFPGEIHIRTKARKTSKSGARRLRYQMEDADPSTTPKQVSPVRHASGASASVKHPV